MRTQTSILALLKLMSDSDISIRENARNVLMEYGYEVIPELAELEDECLLDEELNKSLTEILTELRFLKIKNELKDWKASRSKDLEKVLYIISTFQFPELTWEEYHEMIEQIYHKCSLKIGPRQTSFEKVKMLNTVFFDVFDFVVHKKLPLSPFDIYLNSVMDTKEGSDLAIGLIYSIVAQKLHIPIYGVVSMNNRTPFVLAHLDENNILPTVNWEIKGNGVLFYIGIDNKGLIIEPPLLLKLYEVEGLPTDRIQFEPSPNSLIVKKYLNEIYKSYANQIYFRYKLPHIAELLEIMKS